jgi:PAS domain S-box-containing protein
MSPEFRSGEKYDPTAELVKVNPVPSAIVDTQTLAIMIANEAAAGLLGYPISELLGRSLIDFIPGEDAPAARQAAEEPVPEGMTYWRCFTRTGKMLYLKIKYRETVYQQRAARFIVVIESSSEPFPPESQPSGATESRNAP